MFRIGDSYGPSWIPLESWLGGNCCIASRLPTKEIYIGTWGSNPHDVNHASPKETEPIWAPVADSKSPANFGLEQQLSNEKNPGWLRYIGDYVPTQLYRDYNKPRHKDPVINHPG